MKITREDLVAYCEDNGYDESFLDTLTPEQTKELTDEVEDVKKGHVFLDGFFSVMNTNLLRHVNQDD